MLEHAQMIDARPDARMTLSLDDDAARLGAASQIIDVVKSCQKIELRVVDANGTWARVQHGCEDHTVWSRAS